MPLTLEQYATYLDTRGLPWPAPPEVQPPRAKPHVRVLPQLRAVTWNIYGTLLAIPGGELAFESPNKFVMEVALDKTIQEFNMWASMSRKPGQPAEFMREIYAHVLREQSTFAAGPIKHPEVLAERVWESIIKKLLQKDYRWDTGFFGAQRIQSESRVLLSRQLAKHHGVRGGGLDAPAPQGERPDPGGCWRTPRVSRPSNSNAV